MDNVTGGHQFKTYYLSTGFAIDCAVLSLSQVGIKPTLLIIEFY